jgi:uncharacterized damage-inducible protein DinB
MAKPKPTDFPPFFEKYIALVNAESPSEAVRMYAGILIDFYTSLPEEKADYRYAPGKWTIKDVLQHVIDTERIFSYRLLRIARKDNTPLASFDENSFAENAFASGRSLAALKEEFIAVRKATDLLIQSLTEDQLSATGISGNFPATANSLGFNVFGHLLHHKIILEERYLYS